MPEEGLDYTLLEAGSQLRQSSASAIVPSHSGPIVAGHPSAANRDCCRYQRALIELSAMATVTLPNQFIAGSPEELVRSLAEKNGKFLHPVRKLHPDTSTRHV
jgi:hypothetical protein